MPLTVPFQLPTGIGPVRFVAPTSIHACYWHWSHCSARKPPKRRRVEDLSWSLGIPAKIPHVVGGRETRGEFSLKGDISPKSQLLLSNKKKIRSPSAARNKFFAKGRFSLEIPVIVWWFIVFEIIWLFIVFEILTKVFDCYVVEFSLVLSCLQHGSVRTRS